jgi:hypothetical protein
MLTFSIKAANMPSNEPSKAFKRDSFRRTPPLISLWPETDIIVLGRDDAPDPVGLPPMPLSSGNEIH